MVKSMTAFASGEIFRFPFRIKIEVRAYNSRYLDLSLKITQGYRLIEEHVREFVFKRIIRGRIEVIIGIECDSKKNYQYEVDMSKAESFFEALKLLNSSFNLNGININTLLGAGGIIKAKELDKDYDQILISLDKCLKQVLIDLDKMKLEEGRNLADDFYKRLSYIENILNQIEINTYNLTEFHKVKLENSIKKLINGFIEIDHDRIIHEASILASKCDISEEIIRSKSHIKLFRTIMDGEISAGKKLNFLVQELNREINTMGSKAGRFEVSHMIILLKVEVEKIKEQIQNIE